MWTRAIVLGKRTIILGAGASAASRFQLPVMRGFFSDHLAATPELAAFLSWLYPGVDPAEYNLEDVLAFLELSRHRLDSWGMYSSSGHSPPPEHLYQAVLSFLKHRLSIPKAAACDLHARLFRKLDSQDTIVTLNYDLIADQALLEIEPRTSFGTLDQDSRIGKLDGLLHEQNLAGGFQPPSLMGRERERGFYLKLHGSLDWLHCPTSGCRSNNNIFAKSVKGDVWTIGQEEGEPCRFCGAALTMMIIPPVSTKRLQDRGRIAFLWNLALRELRLSQSIVFIGTSLAPTDFELRWLLRQAMSESSGMIRTVTVVNPSQVHRQLIQCCLPGRAWTCQEYPTMEEYVSDLEHAAVTV